MSNSEAKIEIYSQSQLFTPENQGADTKEISLCAIAHSRLKILDMIDEPKSRDVSTGVIALGQCNLIR